MKEQKSRALIFLSFFLAVSCHQKEGETILYRKELKSYETFMNGAEKKSSPNSQSDITLVNDEYPIELILYEDGSFYYILENLGEGRGTWIYQDGELKLHAKRRLFDMDMTIVSSNPEGTEWRLNFRDRFKFRDLPLDARNIEITRH